MWMSSSYFKWVSATHQAHAENGSCGVIDGSSAEQWSGLKNSLVCAAHEMGKSVRSIGMVGRTGMHEAGALIRSAWLVRKSIDSMDNRANIHASQDE